MNYPLQPTNNTLTPAIALPENFQQLYRLVVQQSPLPENYTFCEEESAVLQQLILEETIASIA